MDFGGEQFNFEPKDHEIRRIELNADALEVIRGLEKMKLFSPWVFVNKYSRPWDRTFSAGISGKFTGGRE